MEITLGIWKNLKKGTEYIVTGTRINCNNALDQNGQIMVEYFSKDGNFCREISEFLTKFELVEPAMAKIPIEDEPYQTRVAGTSLYQPVVSKIDASWRARLVREPSNPHDDRAVRVDVYETIGYIPRRENAPFAEALNAGKEVAVSIRSVGHPYGDKTKPKGVLIDLVVPASASRYERTETQLTTDT
jgi:hypothetical protein